MTNNEKALEVLVEKFSILISEYMSKLRFNRSFKSMVLAKNTDGTYQINYKCHKYDVPNGMGIDLEVGQMVWVMIPNGIFRHMFIYALHRKK